MHAETSEGDRRSGERGGGAPPRGLDPSPLPAGPLARPIAVTFRQADVNGYAGTVDDCIQSRVTTSSAAGTTLTVTDGPSSTTGRLYSLTTLARSADDEVCREGDASTKSDPCPSGDCVGSVPVTGRMRADGGEFGVVISELMYHPLSDVDGDEFIELYNAGTVALDVSGWCFEGVTYCFPAVSVDRTRRVRRARQRRRALSGHVSVPRPTACTAAS